MCILALLMGSFIQLSLQVVPLPQSVVDFTTSQMERLHHNNFHQVRMLWNYLDAGEQSALTRLGWAPPRPAYAYPFLPDLTSVIINGTAGEDFLFMHHRMIDAVNAVGADDSWSVIGWDDCPAPGDTEWPVPPTYQMPGDPITSGVINDAKTDAFYTDVIQPEEAWLKDDDNLRTLTIGELGVRLEFFIHTWFHLRFSAANSVGYRVQDYHPTAAVPSKWDVPEYDWLADFYSAHANPYFWKIHGWIEKKIDAWKAANSITTIQWAGTWDGGPMGVQAQLEQIAQVFSRPSSGSSNDDSKAGIILGCVLGGLAIILAFVLAMTYLLHVKKTNRKSTYSPAQSSPSQRTLNTHQTDVQAKL